MATSLLVSVCWLGMSLAIPVDDVTKSPKDAVKTIDTKDMKIPGGLGRPQRPKEITSKDELSTTIDDVATFEALAKQVDFTQYKLLIFSWGGSGQDLVGVKVQDKESTPTVTFTYRPGRTKDLRMHVRVFAVSRKAKIELPGAR